MIDDAPTVELFGLPVRAETLSEAVDRIEHAVECGKTVRQVSLNASKVSYLASSPEVQEVLSSFEMIHADGASVLLASRLLGCPLPERVAGIDLMQALVSRAAQRGLEIFLLGARADVVEQCATVLVGRHPGLRIAGTQDGYWDAGDEAAERAVVDRVSASGAKLLFVALPSPRKERFLERHGERLGTNFAMGVGGAFDVITGRVPRAPEAWQRHGFEWAYRLQQEPRRLWRRYLMTNSHFAWLLCAELLRGRRTLN